MIKSGEVPEQWAINPKTGERLLAPLRASRKKLRVGDVFAMCPGDFYLFGTVVRTDVSLEGGVVVGPEWREMVPQPGDSNLLYVFEGKSPTIAMPADLRDRSLLIPPEITNRQGWLRGYFETIGHLDRPIDHGPHSFCDTRRIVLRYYDEAGTRLAEPHGDVGMYYLSAFELIAVNVHRALRGELLVPPGSPRIGHGAQVYPALAGR